MTKRQLWLRQAEMIIGTKKFIYGDLHFDFDIKFDEWAEPNISEGTFYNLSDNSINQIRKGNNLILNAGYRGDMALICLGKIEKVWTEWEGVDRLTRITIGDGAEEWFMSRISRTYKRGTKASAVLRDITNMFGLEIGDFHVANDVTYQLGKSISGMLYQALIEVARDTGCKVYIMNSKIFIRPYLKGDPTGFLLNSDSGLIGSPERLEKKYGDLEYIGYNVKMLLNHRVNVDSIIRIDSKNAKGNFRVVEGRHASDEWITECEVMPL